MINREKLVALSLLTALIMTLVLTNLNVTSIGATDGNPATTITFDTDITMEFETGNTAWFETGKWLYVYNETKGENITELGPGTVLMAEQKPGWGYPAPEPGDWYYIYGGLYGLYIAFEIDQVWGPSGTPTFNITRTWDHWLRVPRNFTGDNDFHETPVTSFEAEGMISTIETGVEYWAWLNLKVYDYIPTVGSHWKITYHDALYGNALNISSVGTGYEEFGEWYYPVEFGALWNTTGDLVDSITVPDAPDGFCPVEGLEGPQLITELGTSEDYYISSPPPLLPDNSTWWNITKPDELNTTQFQVKNSSKKPFVGVFRSYMRLNNTMGTTIVPAPGVETIEARWANASKVAEIGSWYNVIDGPTPAPHTWWNTTESHPSDETLVDVQFYVDAAGEGVFHIDETSGDVTVSPAVDNVTAKELTPAIYIYPDETIDENLTPGKNFTVSIKTNYTLQVWSYEFTLEWNPNVLNITGMEQVTNGDLFTGATFINGTVDNVAGELSLTGAKFDYTPPDPAPQVYPTPDNCTLASVTFTVNGTGDSDITLGSETRLVKITKGGLGEEQNVVDDATGKMVKGYFSNAGAVRHDVVLISVVFNTTVALDLTYQSADAPLVQINVTVKNNGTLAETFDVKLYYDNPVAGNLIGTQTVSNLGAGASDTRTFNWNITYIPPRNHTIVVKATLAFSILDANPADNLLVDGDVHVKIPGDITGDGEVDFDDFRIFSGKYGISAGEPGHEPRCDFNYDGFVDFDDFIPFAGNYGMIE